MALKYECDECKGIKDPDEMYGAGVFTEEEGKGRNLVWQEEDQKYGLSIFPFKADSTEQICKGCVVGMVSEFLAEMLEADELNQAAEEGGLARPYTAGEYLEEFSPTQLPPPQWFQDYMTKTNKGEFADVHEDTPGGNGADPHVHELLPVPTLQEPDPSGRLEDKIKFDDNCICLTLQGSDPEPGIGRTCPARIHRPR